MRTSKTSATRHSNTHYLNSHRFFNAGGDNFVTTKATAELAYKDGMREMAIFGSLQPWETAYDAAYSLLTAIKVANSTEPENIIKALHEIKFKGSSGKEDSFDENGLLVRGITLHEVVGGEMVRPKQPPSPQSLAE